MITIFGLLYTAIVSIGAYLHSVNESAENEKNKKLYKHSNGLTYIDTKGRSRLLSNNEIVFYTNDKNGDYVLADSCGNIYRNFSEEKRTQECCELKKTASKNRETTYCCDNNNHSKDWECKGKRFKDFETGDVYIIRCINNKYYYMNMSDGLIVRKTDWQLKQDEKMKNVKSYFLNELDIESFNKKQKEVDAQNKRMLYRDFEYNSFCDNYK